LPTRTSVRYTGEAMAREIEDFALPDLQSLVHVLRDAVRQLESGCLDSAEASEAVRVFAEVERLAEAGTILAARQVERSGAWRKEGHRSAAHWMAQAAGVAVGQAVGALEMARRLEHLPRTARAFAEGHLSLRDPGSGGGRRRGVQSGRGERAPGGGPNGDGFCAP
jgi:hypothetical protein